MRPTYLFPVAVVEAIAGERYRHPDPRVQERMEILWLKSRNETHERIAELANVSRSTVQRTLRIYAAKGLDGIRSFGWKGQPSALTPHRETIEEAFRQHPPHTAHEAARRIEELTGVRRKVSRVLGAVTFTPPRGVPSSSLRWPARRPLSKENST